MGNQWMKKLIIVDNQTYCKGEYHCIVGVSETSAIVLIRLEISFRYFERRWNTSNTFSAWSKHLF